MITGRYMLVTAAALFANCGCTKPAANPTSQAYVRVAVSRASVGHLPVFLAKDLGYYQQEGVEVAVSEVAAASKVMQAVIGGSADIGAGAPENVLQIAAEGRVKMAIRSDVTGSFASPTTSHERCVRRSAVSCKTIRPRSPRMWWRKTYAKP